MEDVGVNSKLCLHPTALLLFVLISGYWDDHVATHDLISETGEKM